MNRLSIDIGGRTSFEPGEEIAVSVQWSLDRPPDAVELRVVWNTTGAEQRDLQVVETVRIESPPAEETRQLTVRLPREPYSFQGKRISLVWAGARGCPLEGVDARKLSSALAGRKSSCRKNRRVKRARRSQTGGVAPAGAGWPASLCSADRESRSVVSAA